MEYLSGDAATSNLDLVCVMGSMIYFFNLANLQSSFIASTVNPIGGPLHSSLRAKVLRRFRGRTLRSHISLGQAAVHHEVCGINKAAFIASQEDDSMSLLDRLTEPAGGKMDLTPESLLLVVSKPILQKRGAESVSLYPRSGD